MDVIAAVSQSVEQIFVPEGAGWRLLWRSDRLPLQYSLKKSLILTTDQDAERCHLAKSLVTS
jgi:hypothetical protein